MAQSFDINELGFTNSILSAYLTGSENLKPFYQHSPNIEGIKSAILSKQKSTIDRDVLVNVLLEQLETHTLKGLKLEKSKANIEKLLNDKVFTITTGQQLHLYLGPGYFGNKIFSCIQLSNFVNQQISEYETVPVFWLASEDHDTDEINNINLFGENFKADLPANIATGRINTKAIESLTKKLETRLGKETDQNHFFQLCKNAYQKYDNLADATAAIIYELFAEYGIVVINADNPKLKAQFAKIAENEIAQNTTTQLQHDVKTAFDKNNWHYQLMPRTNNLFDIDENGHRKVSEDKIYNTNKDYSPNAMLRPLYQEIILPNIAYVGGQAEINYWLQLKPIFDYYKVDYPIVWVRESFTLANDKQWSKFLQSEKTALFFSQLTEESIQNEYLTATIDKSLIANISALETQLKQLKSKNQNEVWNNLSQELANWSVKTKIAFRRVKEDLLNAPQYFQYKEQLLKIKQQFFDKKLLQERNLSLLELSTNYSYFQLMSNYVKKNNARHCYYSIIDIN